MSAPLSLPQAVVFDWDNTLVDAWIILHQSMNAALTAFDRTPWTLEEAKNRIRKAPRSFFPELFGEEWPTAEKAFYGHYLSQHKNAVTPMPGAEPLLKFLKKEGIYAGVASNKTGSILRDEADVLSWTPYFSRIIGSKDAPRDKPAPDVVHMALSAGQHSPGPHVWFVGDTDIDMECAHATGCTPVFLGANITEEGLAQWPPQLYLKGCDDLLFLLQTMAEGEDVPARVLQYQG